MRIIAVLFHLVLFSPNLILYVMLHDLLPTSKGDYWYYFWPYHVILIGCWIAVEIIMRKGER